MESHKELEHVINKKLALFTHLGRETKKYLKMQRKKKTVLKLELAMASVAQDLKPVRTTVLEQHPELRDLFEALDALYLDYTNGTLKE